MAKAQLLIVEDSKTQAETIKKFLKKQGYDVTWVEDGKSAIQVAKTKPLDLILLDFILPDIKGDEVCRWLKLNQSTKGIPIIILTVKGNVSDKVIGLEAGADDYMLKPYNEIELNARIYACLRTKALQDELREKNHQLEELLSKVEILAITDPLTELYNRRRFQVVLEMEFQKTKRYKTLLSCLMIDIDRFKLINDENGHQIGDFVLQETAQIIRKTFREVDIIARWGGEEFVVLLPHTKKEDALRSATRVLEKISHHKFSRIPDKKITVSIGIASAPDPSIDTGESLINASDIAMYDAKDKGRNQIKTG
ncbi:MAG: diguanylate cyclase [Thermodesulfovibrionia bacterium]|nr:diguanylate cyclase [Thermodesulfovibrionia bacterium]